MNPLKSRIMIGAMAALLLTPVSACSLTTSEPGEGDPDYEAIPDYGEAINEAQDAANKAEDRAREVEEEVQRQMEETP